jgi:hypothetical protein
MGASIERETQNCNGCPETTRLLTPYGAMLRCGTL